MAKLTEQQKAENKAAQKIRDKAHVARLKQYRTALETARTTGAVAQAHAESQACNQAFDEALRIREAKEQDLRGQIAAIEDQIRELRNDPEVERLATRRREASNAWNRLRDEATQQVNAEFPDMQGHAASYPAGWTPPPDVLAAMDAARKTATPESVKPRKPIKKQAS
jgi:septal ring factor EnvC (AmiA/AmiB activator)